MSMAEGRKNVSEVMLGKITEAMLLCKEKGWTLEDLKLLLSSYNLVCQNREVIFCPPRHRGTVLNALGRHPSEWSGWVPGLDAINRAATAAMEERGWAPTQVQKLLLACEAKWQGWGILEVPIKQRRRLYSALQHHPTWWMVAAGYCAQLKALGYEYAEVKAACEALGWGPPSQMDAGTRNAVMGLLSDPEKNGFLMFDKIKELREKQ